MNTYRTITDFIYSAFHLYDVYDTVNPKTRNRKPREIKLCLRCGLKHDHNNSFCSAECCKFYREENKRRTKCEK